MLDGQADSSGIATRMTCDPARGRGAGGAIRVAALVIQLGIFAISALAWTYGMLSLSVACFAIAVIAYVAVPVAHRPAYRIVGLDVVLVVFLAAYSLLVPINYIGAGYAAEQVHLPLLLCHLALAGFATGVLLGDQIILAPGRPSRGADFRGVVVPVEVYRIGWLLVGGGVLIAAVAISTTVGFDAYLSAGYAGRALLKREVGPVELGLYHSVVGAILVASYLFQPTPPRRQLVGSALFACYVGVFVIAVSMLGIRRPTFFLLVGLFAAYDLQRGAAKKIGVMALGGATLFVLALFARFRQVLSDQGPMEAFVFVTTSFDASWLDFSETELGAPFRVLMTAVHEWPEANLGLGESYLNVPLYLLPRQVGVASTSLSQEYTNNFFSADFIAIGGNMGFSPVAEAVVNFGAVGPFAVFLLLGCIVGIVSRVLTKRLDWASVVIYATAVPWIAFFLRSDSASYSKVATYSVVIPMGMAIVACLMSIRAQRRSLGP